MYSSWFSYRLTKPYPFVWFTPVLITGTIIFAILFSFVNLAADGYYLTTVYTTSPNETLAKEYWFNKAPWNWGNKLNPSCQPQNIPIGFEFFTTNLGLSYLLESVTQYQPARQETVHLASLTYLNQTLEACTVDSVTITLKKADQSKNGYGRWWSWDDSNANAVAHCVLSTAVGQVNATFSTQYNAGPKEYDYVVSNDYKGYSSMWWGTRLLDLYWASILKEMGLALFPNSDDFYDAANGTSTPEWTKGQIVFTPNKTDDIRAYEFFDLSYFLLAADSTIYNEVFNNSILYNNIDGLTYTGPLTEGLTWAKVMYSMIMTDLGQTKLPNLLQNEGLLQWALQYPDDQVRQSEDLEAWYSYPCDYCDEDWPNWGAVAAPNANSTLDDQQVPMNQSYTAFKDLMGPLGTKPTTIFNQYACSVPLRKQTGSLILAVVIADLVFLQVFWVLLSWIAGLIVTRQDPSAMSCNMHEDVVAYGVVGRGTPVLGFSRESQQKFPSSRDISLEGLIERPNPV